MATREDVLRHRDDAAVATAVADDLVAALRDAQASGGVASVVLTGGSISRAVHAAVAGHGERDTVDWARVEFWWGDERFVASDDEERNAGQAWEDLLSHLPLDPARVHAMPAADDDYPDVEAAAWAHGRDLREAVADRSDGAWFDVLMLGIGPDGHCASLFPDHPEVASQADVVAVHDSPKPPPTRISMTLPTLARARQVWFVATGEAKADAVARSVAGGEVSLTPSAGPRGQELTRWYVDDAAGAGL